MTAYLIQTILTVPERNRGSYYFCNYVLAFVLLGGPVFRFKVKDKDNPDFVNFYGVARLCKKILDVGENTIKLELR